MQLVIDISETLKDIADEDDIKTFSHIIWQYILIDTIKNGTPLPKGHGRLIDADALVKKMEEREEKLKDDRSMWETAGVETALDMYAPTIIEADKTER